VALLLAQAGSLTCQCSGHNLWVRAASRTVELESGNHGPSRCSHQHHEPAPDDRDSMPECKTNGGAVFVGQPRTECDAFDSLCMDLPACETMLRSGIASVAAGQAAFCQDTPRARIAVRAELGVYRL
jgi:hypothetical protein